MSSSGLVLSTPNLEESTVFTQLKPVRMSGESAEDTSVFEDIKPAIRILENQHDLAQVRESLNSSHHTSVSLLMWNNEVLAVDFQRFVFIICHFCVGFFLKNVQRKARSEYFH